MPFFLVYALCRSRSRWLVAGALAAVAAAACAALLVAELNISGSISSGGRALQEVAHYSATGLDLVTRHRRHGPESFVFLGWLTPILALAGLVLLVRGRRLGLALALGIGAIVPIVLALGTHCPLYGWVWHHFPPLRYPRVPERFMPVACLAIAALVAVAVARIARGAALVAVVAVVLLFADLRLGVSSYRSVRADSANAAYAALRSQPPGRLLELPVLHPSVAHGSLYLYYDMQARRERPSGYSTVAPKAAATLALRLEPLSCGEWRPGTERVLADLGVRYVALHGGIDRRSPGSPGAGWPPAAGASWPETGGSRPSPAAAGPTRPPRSPSPDSGSSSARSGTAAPRATATAPSGSAAAASSWSGSRATAPTARGSPPTERAARCE